MSPDPLTGDILNPQSLNRYTYVMNNPADWSDPLGLKTGLWEQLTGESMGIQASSILVGSNWNEFDLSQIPVVQSGYELGVVNWHPGPSGIEGGSPYTSMLGQLALVPYSQVIGNGFDLFGNLVGSFGQVLSSISFQAQTLKLQVEDVAQGIARNFIDEFKAGGCVADFLDRAAGAPGPAPAGPQPSDVVEAAGAGWAWWYAAENTLSVPLRSTIYREILSGAETLASYASVIPADYVAGVSFVGEMKDMSSGVCQ